MSRENLIRNFQDWQHNNKYFGKQFSILGDSISTLEGYNPPGYKLFYTGETCEKSNVNDMKDTWWGKVIEFFGGELLVNNSWSGSRVTKLPTLDNLFPSGCSDERTSSLHINNVKPDVIIVYLGTNDWAFGAKTGNDTVLLDDDEMELFHFAYSRMISKIRENYPNSEIWCCTISETFMSRNDNFKFPHKYAGTHIEVYNDIIRDVVRGYQCNLIDLYQNKMPYDSFDGSHPTQAGMKTLATEIIRAMAENDVDVFLDCEDEKHDYVVVEEYTGGTDYVCKKCGKKYTDMVIPTNKEDKTMKDDSKYVVLDPDITDVLFSNTIKLTYEEIGKTTQLQKDKITVGREPSCDLFLGKEHQYIARNQATFFFEGGHWYLQDNNSTNGTWINGVKLQPAKKYQLAVNDVIDFAHSVEMTFYKSESEGKDIVNEDNKIIHILNAVMKIFSESNYKDEIAYKLIISALSKAPLYFPVEIDIEAMLGNIDPSNLKPGDTIETQKDVKLRIQTITLKNGIELIPMFTSQEEINGDVSAIRYYPQDYLPMIVKMDRDIVINPFNESRFVLDKSLIENVLMPMVENEVNNEVKQDADKDEQNELLGTVVGEKYNVIKEIAQGGFFKIYLVRDENNKTLAMKACNKTNKHYSPEIYQLIMQEPHIMMKMDHPAIPKVVDVIEDNKYIFIVREYVEGETLKAIITKEGPQAAEKVIEWGKQLCDVLHYLHTLKPSHIYRDMKPGNIILQPDGKLKLIDFGLVRMFDLTKDKDTCNLGTKGYAAPEQYGSRQSDARTDIYGLGMTMHHLVTGVDPTQPPCETKPIRKINVFLPKGLEYIISKCVELKPENRYQSCDELLADLNNYKNLPKGFISKIFGK